MTLRLAIVGCGAVTDDKHLPAALGVEGIELIALVDNNIEQARVLAAKFKIPGIASSIEDIADRLDAVIIATPPHVRPMLAESAFNSGLHVLCEKPLANSIGECLAIIDAAQKNGCVLAVAHMFRFWPTRIRIHEIIRLKTFGHVKSVVATEGKPYLWQSVTGYTVRKELSSGGVLINAGVHTLDTLLWWFGDPIQFDYRDDAVGGLESNVRMELQFPGDIKASFRISRTCMLPYEIRIECEKGTILLPTNSISKYTIVDRKGQKDVFCSEPERNELDNLKDQLRDFKSSILYGIPPRISGEEGMRVIKLIESCYRTKRSRLLPKQAPQPGLTW